MPVRTCHCCLKLTAPLRDPWKTCSRRRTTTPPTSRPGGCHPGGVRNAPQRKSRRKCYFSLRFDHLASRLCVGDFKYGAMVGGEDARAIGFVSVLFWGEGRERLAGVGLRRKYAGYGLVRVNNDVKVVGPRSRPRGCCRALPGLSV